jgi:hypothetical protein
MSDKMIQIPLPFEEPMDDYTAVGIAEGFIACNNEGNSEYLRAWQQLIDTGMAWTLQGWFGRTATALIEEGHCTAPNS